MKMKILQNKKWIVPSALTFAAVLAVTTVVVTKVYGDDDDYRDRRDRKEYKKDKHDLNKLFAPENEAAAKLKVERAVASVRPGRHFPSVQPEIYNKECGSCHYAYPAGLLPKRSWVKTMETLPNHFGEDASLDEKTVAQINDYLFAYAADVKGTKKSGKILRSIPQSETPLTLTGTKYYKKKHEDIKPEIFKRASIKSAANCNACHRGAEKGDFDDDTIVIPR